MKDEYEIIFVPNEGRAIKNNKTNRIYYSEFQIIEEKNKEIERLNNIITEFDKYLVSVKNGCIYNVDEFLYKVVSNIYNKFKELKGVDKE